MRPLSHFFAKLYPPRWRRRYGPEFACLLDDASPTATTALNVFTGALSMQIRTWNTGKILAAAGLVGILAAAGIAFATPNQYVSASVLKIVSPSPPEVAAGINAMAMNILDRKSLAQTITNFGLYPRERARMPVDDVVERMKRSVEIHPVLAAGTALPVAFSVQFNYPDPRLAQKVTQNLTSKFIEGNLTLQVLDPASLPENPVSPNRAEIASFGLLAGLALGGILALVLRLTVRQIPDLPR